MRRRAYLLIIFSAAVIITQGCGQAATDVNTATPVPDTARPEPTPTGQPTEAEPTDQPTATSEAAQPEPTDVPTSTSTPQPTEVEPSPTVTPEPVEPTEPPTATPEPTSEPAEPEGRVLLEERCTVCHTLDRVERAQKPREAWVSTVDRMVSRGAQLSEAETAVLIDYLVETYGP